MNPLQRAGRSLRTAREGTGRTVRWVGNGIASGPRRARARMATGMGRDGAVTAKSGAPAAAAAAPADSGPGAFARARSNLRAILLWAAAGLLVAAWIGWTVYVWIENGAAAGIGVLISWPAVLAVLALLTSPLWAPRLVARERRKAAGEPAAVAGSEAEDAGPAADEDAAESGDAEVTAGSDGESRD